MTRGKFFRVKVNIIYVRHFKPWVPSRPPNSSKAPDFRGFSFLGVAQKVADLYGYSLFFRDPSLGFNKFKKVHQLRCTFI
jgi:hypothetical protein